MSYVKGFFQPLVAAAGGPGRMASGAIKKHYCHNYSLKIQKSNLMVRAGKPAHVINPLKINGLIHLRVVGTLREM
jgi:hypothetical protein